MTTATLSLNRVRELPAINWKIICLVGFFISLFLLVFYVWQIDSLTKSSYIMNNYENQISKLSSENKNLEVSFAESSFLGQVVEKVQALNFQKITSVKYIQVSDNSVATIIK